MIIRVIACLCDCLLGLLACWLVGYIVVSLFVCLCVVCLCVRFWLFVCVFLCSVGCLFA